MYKPYMDYLKCSIGKYSLLTICLLGSCLFFNRNVAAQDYLTATCDGPGGYCNPGSQISINYKSGGSVIIGKRDPRYSFKTDAVLSYCNSPDGVIITGTRGCIDFVRMPLSGSMEGQPWSSLNGYFIGHFTVPNTRPYNNGSKQCISAYISDRDNSLGAISRSYGTSSISSTSALCTGYAPPPPPPDYCYINGGNPISVEFGNVERSDISTNPGGTGTIRKNINLSCVGNGDHTINIKLNMTPTSWSNSQIHTSNGALGVSVSENGRMLNADESFDIHINGNNSLSHELLFSLLRNPGAKVTDITTGTFNASASLIITQP